MRCGCDLSLAGRRLYSTYVGGRKTKSAPQIAIPNIRSADTPNRLKRLLSHFIISHIASVIDSTSRRSLARISSVSPESPYLLTPKRATLPLYP